MHDEIPLPRSRLLRDAAGVTWRTWLDGISPAGNRPAHG